MKWNKFLILVMLFCHIQLTYAQIQETLLWPVPQWPGMTEVNVTTINATFGERHSEIHHAVDVNTENGTYIVASHDGKIQLRDVLHHEETLFYIEKKYFDLKVIKTRYGDYIKQPQLNSNVYSDGTNVYRGDIIGKIKKGGHLHFEVYYFDRDIGDWVAVHPLKRAYKIKKYTYTGNNNKFKNVTIAEVIDFLNIDIVPVNERPETEVDFTFTDDKPTVINDVVLEAFGNSGYSFVNDMQEGVEKLYDYSEIEDNGTGSDIPENAIVAHYDNRTPQIEGEGNKKNKIYTPNLKKPKIILWGSHGVSLQCRDLGVSYNNSSDGIYSASYEIDGETMFALEFNEIYGSQNNNSTLPDETASIINGTTENRILSIYNTKLNDCVGNRKTETDKCRNEEYLGHYDWVKLSHAKGEIELKPVHQKIGGKIGDGVWETRIKKSNERIYQSKNYENKIDKMQYAKANVDALYKDGIRVLGFTVNDWTELDGHKYFAKLPVIVDNFKPYLEEINVQIQDQLFKSVKREFQTTGEVKIEDKKNCIKYTPFNKNIIVKIKASEELKNDDNDKVTAVIQPGDIKPISVQTNNDNTELTFTFSPIVKSELDVENFTEYTIQISGKDLAGNTLLNFPNANPPIELNSFKVPIRTGENRWDLFSQSQIDIAKGIDDALKFKIIDIKTNKDLKLEVIGDGVTIPYCFQGGSPLNKMILTAKVSGGKAPYKFSWDEDCNPKTEDTKCLTIFPYEGTVTYKVAVKDDNGCLVKKDVKATGTRILCVRGSDPNAIDGPEGIDSIRWKAQKDTLPYTIHFENDAKVATGPAQRVYLELPLPAKADPSLFRVGRIGFAGKVFELPLDRPVYQGRLDARDSTGVFVDVTVGVDIDARKAFWILQSVDPTTGLTPPAEKGLLPINDAVTHKGEGFVEFTIKALSTTVTGDTLRAYGNIVFDDNEAILTNTWTNTIDAVAPLSKMTATVSGVIDTTLIPLRWSGKDDTNGSGIGSYAIYAAEDSSAYESIASGILDTTFNYNGLPGHQYRFFVQAIDRTGNEEPLKDSAEVTVRIKAKPYLNLVSVNTIGICSGDSVRLVWSSASIDSVKVDYSTDNGATYATAATKVPDSLRYFAFKIDTTNQRRRFLLRITDAATTPQGNDTLSFIVNPRPTFNVVTQTATICAGAPLALEVNSSSPLSYYWSPSYAVENPDTNKAQFIGTEDTRFIITARDANGCTMIDSAKVKVNPTDSTYLEGIACLDSEIGITRQVFTNIYGCDSIIVFDKIRDTFPPLVITKDIEVQLGGNHQATITPEAVNDGTTDDCTIASLRLSRSVFTDTGRYIVYLIATDSHGNVDSSAAIVHVLLSKYINISLKVFLQGAYNTATSLMNDNLRSQSLIPLTESYSNITNFAHTGGGGGETTTKAVLSITGNNAIVDWVFVELRKKIDPTVVVATRSVLIQRDGDIVDIDGVSPIKFIGLISDDYYVSVRHRNHLGVRTALSKKLTTTTTSIDFTSNLSETLATPNNSQYNAMATVSAGIYGMWGGNANSDGVVKMTGFSPANNDYLKLLNSLGNSTNVQTSVYSVQDLNMDGILKMTGFSPANNDYLKLLNILGSSTNLIIQPY